MKKKIALFLLLTFITIFVVGHSTPKMALRTHLLTMLNGNSLILVFSDIDEIEYRYKDEYSESRFFLIKDSMSHSPFANEYVWGVHRKGFFYFAYAIGKG